MSQKGYTKVTRMLREGDTKVTAGMRDFFQKRKCGCVLSVLRE
jgi:repressor of nif and glnA expression